MASHGSIDEQIELCRQEGLAPLLLIVGKEKGNEWSMSLLYDQSLIANDVAAAKLLLEAMRALLS